MFCRECDDSLFKQTIFRLFQHLLRVPGGIIYDNLLRIFCAEVVYDLLGNLMMYIDTVFTLSSSQTAIFQLIPHFDIASNFVIIPSTLFQ